MSKEKAIEKRIEARSAQIVASEKTNETNVDLPEGFQGGSEVSSFPPTVVFEDPGEFIAGFFNGMKEGVGPNESRMYYIILPHTKEVVAIWGSTILDSKIMHSAVKVGDKILIQRLEDIPSKKKGQSPAKNFRVLVG